MSAASFGFGPPAGAYSGLRRSVIDDVTGQPVVTSAPTGEVVQRSTILPVGRDDVGRLVPALPSLVTGAVEAAKFPGQVYRGETGVYDPATGHVSEEAIGKAADIAGLAFTGSLPFKAPAGALRSFGGAAERGADDVLGSLEAALSKGIADNPQPPPTGPRRLDPNALSWDLYHGSTPGPDFRRFDPQVGSNPAERGAVFFAPSPETASGYASATAQGGEAGNRVFRATVEPGRTKVFDLADMAETDPAFTARAREITAGQGGAGHGTLFDEYMTGFRASRAQDREIAGQLREMGYAPGDPSPVSYGWGHIGAAVERAKAEGLDTAILRGLAEHGGDDQVIALTPGRVRSRYSGDLLYSAAPVAAAGGVAALAAPDVAQAATSQGTSPVSASPFGSGASMAPEDLARLFGRMPLGAPQGFAPIAENETDVQRLERATGMVPRSVAPALRAGLADVAAPARPGPSPVPLPPARPAEFSTAEADLPAPGAVPIMAAPGAPATPAPPAAAPDGPSFGDRMLKGLRDNGDYLGALGAGLLSSPTWAGGISAGMQLASKTEKDRAVTDLAKAEYGLKARKLAQETGALSGNAALLKRAYPGLSDQEAMAQASNSSALTEALKIVRDPNHGRENDPAVIRTKAQAQAEGAAAGKPDETYVQMPEEERVSLGLPAGAYQRDSKGKVSPVNPSGTTINMGAEKAQDATVGKGYGDYQLDLATKGRNAGSTLNTLALMEQAMKTPGFYSGVGGEGIKRANQFLGALGVKDSRAASAAEVFDALSNKVVLDGLGGSLGPGISNTDRDYIARTAPTLAQSEQGNRDLIGVARNLAQRQQQVSKLARDYAAKNGGRLDSGFDQALDEFAASNPLFPQAREGASASAPKEPPQGAPNGARQGRDGMWYVPDPNRPGKYLKVQ